ncbi:MAG: hypothetical protein LBT02_03505 [Rickettsiales bacterium]|jgi:hypothetical protein|nr:hypothetical protein [Rickettsiales bacterium]
MNADFKCLQRILPPRFKRERRTLGEREKDGLQNLGKNFMRKAITNNKFVLLQNTSVLIDTIERKINTGTTIDFAIPFFPTLIKKDGLPTDDEAILIAIDNAYRFVKEISIIINRSTTFTFQFDTAILDWGEPIAPSVAKYIKSVNVIFNKLQEYNNINETKNLVQLRIYDTVGEGFFDIDAPNRILTNEELKERFDNSIGNIKNLVQDNFENFRTKFEEMCKKYKIPDEDFYINSQERKEVVERNKKWLIQFFPEVTHQIEENNLGAKKERVIDLFRAVLEEKFRKSNSVRLSPHGRNADEVQKIGFDFFLNRRTQSREPWIGTYVEYENGSCDLLSPIDLFLKNDNFKIDIFKKIKPPFQKKILENIFAYNSIMSAKQKEETISSLAFDEIGLDKKTIIPNYLREEIGYRLVEAKREVKNSYMHLNR